MPSKEEFRNSISEKTIIDEKFCKRLLAYSLYNPDYLEEVRFLCEVLFGLPFSKYYDWYQKWKDEQETVTKRVALWYRKRVEDDWERKKVRQQSADRKQSRYRFAGFPENW